MSVRHASRSIVDALPITRSSSYICRQCMRNAQSPQTFAQRRCYASEGPETLPFAERVRRKLWKGKPPGPENVDDLYGGPGALETMYRERKERRTKGKSHENLQRSQPVKDSGAGDVQATNSKQRPQPKTVADGVANEATRPSKDRKDIPQYKPATTWDGLTFLGHKGHWKEMPVREEDEYQSWLASPVRPNWSYDELVALMHQAITEFYLFGPKVSERDVNAHVPHERLQDAQFHLSADGRINRVKFPKQPSEKPDKSAVEGAAPVDPTQSRRPLYTPNDTSFLDARLDMKDGQAFHILKRFTTLTNHPIPDPILSNIISPDRHRNTLRILLTDIAAAVQPKPANLAARLLSDETLAAQSNLLVLARRETPVDREKEVGRWKVIERELKERGLPVLGKLEVRP